MQALEKDAHTPRAMQPCPTARSLEGQGSVQPPPQPSQRSSAVSKLHNYTVALQKYKSVSSQGVYILTDDIKYVQLKTKCQMQNHVIALTLEKIL